MTSKKSKAQERADRAAIAFAEAKKRERRRNLLAGLGVVLAVLLIVGAGVAINALRGGNDEKGVEAAAPTAGSTDYGLVVGEDSAPHKIVVYEDFLCPICGVLEATAGERINALIDDGTVQVDYRPISILDRFGPYSGDALNAFFVVRDTAGPEVAKSFHDVLYANQPSEEGPVPGHLVARRPRRGGGRHPGRRRGRHPERRRGRDRHPGHRGGVEGQGRGHPDDPARRQDLQRGLELGGHRQQPRRGPRVGPTGPGLAASRR